MRGAAAQPESGTDAPGDAEEVGQIGRLRDDKEKLDDIECAYMEIEIGNKLKDKSIIMQGNIDLGRGLYALGKYDFALQYVHKALDKCLHLVLAG